jgi:transcriptional regulator GlxA family with amidase domain
MIRTVAVPLIDDFAMFELGIACEVFGLDRTWAELERFDFRVCAEDPTQPLRSSTGPILTAPFGFEAMDDADLIVIPAVTIRDVYPEALLDAVRRASERGALLLSICSGAFVLGAAGLLDGRPCTTHWRYAAELARRHPEARIDPGVLFVDDGDLITGAGTSAGIDACLHVVRREVGAAAAATIARNMVVPPQRDGGQRQYIDGPAPAYDDGVFGRLLEELTESLAEPHTVASMAESARMSSRSFARRFAEQTGVPPMRWLTRQRVLHAKLLLESTRAPIDDVARSCGFASATLLRHHFTAEMGVPPTRYRTAFATA